MSIFVVTVYEGGVLCEVVFIVLVSPRNEYKVARLTVAPHRSYIRVFEVTRGQTALAESCPELIK